MKRHISWKRINEVTKFNEVDAFDAACTFVSAIFRLIDLADFVRRAGSLAFGTKQLQLQLLAELRYMRHALGVLDRKVIQLQRDVVLRSFDSEAKTLQVFSPPKVFSSRLSKRPVTTVAAVATAELLDFPAGLASSSAEQKTHW